MLRLKHSQFEVHNEIVSDQNAPDKWDLWSDRRTDLTSDQISVRLILIKPAKCARSHLRSDKLQTEMTSD